ncbi:MAG: uracil-DNA glycosylase [Bifidobacteriaceae bacterium]|nr:uracil-DNA glycosylase [Bifidobacteriaceae bacterium]MCI1978833.1 uracil-DNA glycosylase [Bifidobacteriaceae bacterium]
MRKPLNELMDPEWAENLAPVEPDIRHMGDFLRGEIAARRPYLPANDNIFRAFAMPMRKVKVLIVGQDPYPTPGHPIGLSFAADPSVHPLPASLRNIFTEMVDDLQVPFPANGDLRPWAHQGVMLLNRCLTVSVDKPASHRGKGWEAVTEQAIKALNARTDENGKPLPLVAILWGNDARSLKPLLNHAVIIESPHPSPLSAHRGFFGSKPFSRTNSALESMGATPIDWALPSAPAPTDVADF